MPILLIFEKTLKKNWSIQFFFVPLHQQKRDCNNDNVKNERKQIMMTTVMIIAVVAIMIAQAVHVNNKIEKGLRYGHFM